MAERAPAAARQVQQNFIILEEYSMYGMAGSGPVRGRSGQRRLVRLKFARHSHRTHDAAILGVAHHAHMQIYMSSGCGG